MTSFAILGTAVAAPLPKERPKPKPTVVGEWVVEKGTVGGKEQPREGETVYLFREDGTYAVYLEGRPFVDGRKYATDPKTAPATIDLFSPGASTEPLYRGIYKVEGDALTICYSDRGDPRPTKFESTPYSTSNLKVFKRVKKD